MGYSGATQAKQVREILGKALATLQLDPTIPAEASEVASYMAQAVGSLFVAETAPNDASGRQAVRAALGLLGQSLAQMQQLQPPIPAIEASMSALAQGMGLLFPLTIAAESMAPSTPAWSEAAPQPAPAVQPSPVVQPAPVAQPSPVVQAAPVAQPAPVASQPHAANPHSKVTTQPAPTGSAIAGGGRSSKSTLIFAEIPPTVVSITTSPVDPAPSSPRAAAASAPASTAAAPAPQASAASASAQASAASAPAATASNAVNVSNPGAIVSIPAGIVSALAAGPSAPTPTPTTATPAPSPTGPARPEPHSVPPPGSPLFGALAPSPEPAPLSFGRPAPSSPGSVHGYGATAPATQGLAARAGALASDKAYAAATPVDTMGRRQVEANIGLRTEANFWVGFEDEIARGGVFVPTYEDLEPGSAVVVLVTLPEGASFRSAARVRFIRDPSDVDPTLEPGLGLAFESLAAEHRDLARQFIARRRPLFYDLG